MLLYSTTLDIKDSLTKDDFIKLVIRWNQTSPHEENVIKDLVWNGERNIRYGDEYLWLEIQEYRNKNIIAVRFEKRGKDGDIWDTDYIMDFETMKMTIQLDRSYTEEAQMEDLKFSTPYFVSMLIDAKYVCDDNDLPVTYQSVVITEENISLVTNVINGYSQYQLPIVYITKTMCNEDPIDVHKLCHRLKGVAHILLQKDIQTNRMIRIECNDNNEYYGRVGIYFPNGNHKKYYYRNYVGRDNSLFEKVVRIVFQYMNVQEILPLSTWDGVNNSLLRDKYNSQKAERVVAEQAKREAETEVEEYIGIFDEENAKLKRQINELTQTNMSLKIENQKLREKLSNVVNIPILFQGNEEEFYPGEIKEMILDAVADILKNSNAKTRRWDVLNDVLQHNDYQNVADQKEQQVKTLFSGYKTMSGTMRHQLLKLGIEVSEEGKHYRLTYYGDARYKVTMAKTGSDWREGRNISSTILNKMM